jgi:hypothetical protein
VTRPLRTGACHKRQRHPCMCRVCRVPSRAHPSTHTYPTLPPPVGDRASAMAMMAHTHTRTHAHTHTRARANTHTPTLLPFIVGTYKTTVDNTHAASCVTCPGTADDYDGSGANKHYYCTGDTAAPIECTAGERGCVCTRVCGATCVAASGGHACVWEVGRW